MLVSAFTLRHSFRALLANSFGDFTTGRRRNPPVLLFGFGAFDCLGTLDDAVEHSGVPT